MALQRGDVVLVPFPFSDLSTTVTRYELDDPELPELISPEMDH
jgi:hypothetical protein